MNGITMHIVSSSQRRYFFVSFCVPNANSIITTARIQFVFVKSETRHSSRSLKIAKIASYYK